MAGELQFAISQAGLACYFNIRNTIGQIWNTNTNAFETYQTVNYTSYAVGATQQGAASGYYIGTMPVAIPPGSYNVISKQSIGINPAETDPVLAEGDIQWNGLVVPSLADTATSGQISAFLPVRLERGSMVQNYGIYFKSSTDHISPFTSGIVSGQIARDGGPFVAFERGVFTEIGLGWYNLDAMTSGDLLANTAKIVFTATMISGGNADPVAQFFVLQRTSGQEVG